jgi:outer membrane protein
MILGSYGALWERSTKAPGGPGGTKRYRGLVKLRYTLSTMCTPRPPCARLIALACLAGTLLPGLAQAQFANHAVGLEVGGMWVLNPEDVHGNSPKIGSGGGLGLYGSLYVESGFELQARVLITIHERIANPNYTVVGVLPTLGFRYLFSEEYIRPFIGLDIAYLAFVTNDYDAARFALVPVLGIDFFPSENFSIGLQVEPHVILDLVPQFWVGFALAGVARVGWHF